MFGYKIQKKENLPYGCLTHWKLATMVAKIWPVRVTHGGWCCARLTHSFLKLAPSRDFKTSSRVVKKTIGSHLKYTTFALWPFFFMLFLVLMGKNEDEIKIIATANVTLILNNYCHYCLLPLWFNIEIKTCIYVARTFANYPRLKFFLPELHFDL